MKKIILLIAFVLSSVFYAQENNQLQQFDKIKKEFHKYHDTKISGKFFYEFLTLQNNILVIDKFHYINNIKNAYDRILVPLKEMDVSSAKYRRGIVFNTKGNRKLIKYYAAGKVVSGTGVVEKETLNLHPRAGKKNDKMIMEMLITLFNIK